MTAATRVAAPGTVLAGKLRVERLIGEGAMGVVYEATDITLRRRVAVKLVHPDFVGDEEKRRRFGREAYAVARLQSQHVTQVLEISELDDGTPYLVMELLEGHPLDRIIEEQSPLPIDVALDFILQALDAIAEAHAIGLVHRDLKPANLYLATRRDRSPIVKVLDFGLVKDLSANAVKLTVEGSTMGSPAYMAPELVNGDATVDARVDVWAIGVTLHELLTRELPFEGRSIPLMLQQILRDPPTPLRARRPDAPAELEQVIQRCLAKAPSARYADAADLSRALVAVRTKLPAVSEATKTVRLPEGTHVPPGMSPMDMLDVSKVRPRVRKGDVQGATAKRARPAPPASPIRTVIVAALVTAAAASAIGYVAWKLVAEPRPPRPAPSAAPATPIAIPEGPASAAPSATDAPAAPALGMELADLPPAEQDKWRAAAADLSACAAHASDCSRELSIGRSVNKRRAIVMTAAKGCAVPPALRTCVVGAIKRHALATSAKQKIKLSFP